MKEGDSMKPITIHVPGTPKPGGSKTAFPFRRNDGSLGARVVDAAGKGNATWRNLVVVHAKQAHKGPPMKGPIRLSVTFRMPRPKRHYRGNGKLRGDAPLWHVSRPDTTKLLRAVEDALTDAGLWADDGCVASQTAVKCYADQPGCVIEVFELCR